MPRWLVAVDDSSYAQYAFNFAISMMKPDDHLYLMNVQEESGTVYVGYTTPMFIESIRKSAEERARKILVHYGRKAQNAKVHFTMMKGSAVNPGEMLSQAVERYEIDNLVMGRRSLGSLERWWVGSTSKFCVENCQCNVTVIKAPFGPAEEHDSKVEVIAAEEHERIRRLEEDSPAEVHDLSVDVKAVEENERRRRMDEQAHLGGQMLHKVISHYKFHDDILKLNKEDKQSE